MAGSERRHIPVGKQHIGVGNVCIWCDQPMPCREILLDENKRLLQRSRDEDTARIRLNHARIEAEAENARLTALLAERDAEIALLVEAGQALIAKSPCFITIRPGGNDIECCQFCLTDNGHAPGCEWVGLVAALAARHGEVQG